MPRMLYGIGDGVELRIIYYSAWDRKVAICPSCGYGDRLTPTVLVKEPIDLGISWSNGNPVLAGQVNDLIIRIRKK